MRLLQFSLRRLLYYSLLIVLICIPVSIFSIRSILEDEVDEALVRQNDQFIKHIKGFEYLDDLEVDLEVFNKLSYNMSILPYVEGSAMEQFTTLSIYDSLDQELKPFRSRSSFVDIRDKKYVLTTRLSLVETEDLIFAIVLTQILLLVLLVGGVIWINRSLSKNIWKPFYKTLEQLKAYQLDKNEPINTDESQILEFNDLNKTVQHLIDRNKKIFFAQKEFIENASHELQTPLAIFQTKLDLLMQQPALAEAEANTIQELEATAQRMSRLNKDLLLLSKIDNDQFLERQKIQMAPIILDLISNLKPVAEGSNISFQSEINPFLIVANKTLTEILLSNLIHNAVKHTPSNGSISIYTKDSVFKITNSGPSLRMPSENVFDRFTKEGSIGNSTGLGLAIAKKICEVHNFNVSYMYDNHTHQFTVIF